MTRTLLLRGMLVGVVAGTLVFFFARWLGEPQVERAIAFEQSMDHSGGNAEPEMISRHIQRTIGLLTGVVVYGTAMGGLFGLVFTLAYGRIGPIAPRALSAVLAALGFLAIVLVPDLKYPANPPAVGNPDTIGFRTASFFLLIVFSVGVMVFALQIGRHLAKRFGPWNGWSLAAILYVAVLGLIVHLLPEIDEVPAGFPATLLWKFRVAALEVQAVLWATFGALFGWLTERNFPSR
jgi:predicted cobalt transporter CbtA